jgi:hypothetical protein
VYNGFPEGSLVGKTGGVSDCRFRPEIPLCPPAFRQSPEYVILTKLEWDRITPSERQIQDAAQVLRVQGDKLDFSYTRFWDPTLGVADKLESLLQQWNEIEKDVDP